MNLRKFKLTTIDFYIIRKFLGTFFFALLLIICIAVIFDVAEKIDDFMEKKATLKLIVFNYYFNFIPYYLKYGPGFIEILKRELQPAGKMITVLTLP